MPISGASPGMGFSVLSWEDMSLQHLSAINPVPECVCWGDFPPFPAISFPVLLHSCTGLD